MRLYKLSMSAGQTLYPMLDNCTQVSDTFRVFLTDSSGEYLSADYSANCDGYTYASHSFDAAETAYVWVQLDAAETASQSTDVSFYVY
jgi:hypothetical protein